MTTSTPPVTSPPGQGPAWLICIVVSSLILWVTEIVKIFRRRAAKSTTAELATVPAAQAAA